MIKRLRKLSITLRVMRLTMAAAVLLFSMPVTSEAAIAIIVSPQSDIDTITPELARHIFLRRINKLPNGERIEPVELPKYSQVKKDFDRLIFQKSSIQIKAYWARLTFTGKGKKPRTLQTDKQVIELIAKNPGIIGYVSPQFVTDDVKVLLLAPEE